VAKKKEEEEEEKRRATLWGRTVSMFAWKGGKQDTVDQKNSLAPPDPNIFPGKPHPQAQGSNSTNAPAPSQLKPHPSSMGPPSVFPSHHHPPTEAGLGEASNDAQAWLEQFASLVED